MVLLIERNYGAKKLDLEIEGQKHNDVADVLEH